MLYLWRKVAPIVALWVFFASVVIGGLLPFVGMFLLVRWLIK